MGLALPTFAVAFNALLWLARAGLSPVIAPYAGGMGSWAATLLGPLCLTALFVRLDLARREALVLVAALSLALAELFARS